MSTFWHRDEMNVYGPVWDREHGIIEAIEGEGEKYEPYLVAFLRLWSDNTWDCHMVHVPMAFCHEKCEDHDLVEWYLAVYGTLKGLVQVCVSRPVEE